MEGQRQRSGLFSVLKRVLKAQGIQYRQLADMMGVSEPTVKRIFQDQDCKLSRLMEICELIGLSITELVELDRAAMAEVSELPLSTEKKLASDPALTAYFMLLMTRFTPQEIAYHNQLDATDGYRYLRELEKLELIRLGRNDQVHFLVSRPLRWRIGGPLHQMLVQVNQRFIGEVLDRHPRQTSPFYSTSRLLSPQSITRLQEEVDSLYQSFQKQATLDQLYYPLEQLQPFKLVTTMAPFDVRRYFSVPPFDQRSR